MRPSKRRRIKQRKAKRSGPYTEHRKAVEGLQRVQRKRGLKGITGAGGG